jgi:hypothetical protein
VAIHKGKVLKHIRSLKRKKPRTPKKSRTMRH